MAVDAHVDDEEKTINIHSYCVCILLNQMRPFIEIIIPWIFIFWLPDILLDLTGFTKLK